MVVNAVLIAFTTVKLFNTKKYEKMKKTLYIGVPILYNIGTPIERGTPQ